MNLKTNVMKFIILKTALISFSASMLLFSCSGQSDDMVPPGNNTGGNNNSNAWLIPRDEVFDGGPGKDGIPSIDNPKFSDVSSIDFLASGDLVLGVNVGGEIRAYPHPILDWHEIVNDEVGGKPLAITYCPLTGTGIGWVREVNGWPTTFGVSGLLYNTNLIPYDRNTNSNWSQILLKGVNGPQSGKEIETYPVLETTWQTWKTMFPGSKVLNTNTGFSRNYGNYPYGNYRTNHDLLLFPVVPDDKRLPRKQRGLGLIINEKAKFYPVEKFGSAATVFHDVFENVDLVVVGSKDLNFVAAFERKLTDGTLLEFSAISETGNPVVMKDSEGSEWNVFGEAVAGPREGSVLKPAQSFVGYWFAWGAFYPGTEIFEE